MSKLDDWTAIQPSRKAAPKNKAATFVRTSVSWTPYYPEALTRLLLDSQQAIGDPSFNRSLVMRAAVRALEQMDLVDRLRVLEQVKRERDEQG